MPRRTCSPFHKLFFIPVKMTEKYACYCYRILEGGEVFTSEQLRPHREQDPNTEMTI